jgi:TetR/AcrR family transcriptional regulator, fatty acid metabolism regulator protein
LDTDFFMPRITAERRQDRHRSILDAARRVLVEKGLHEASMSDIARDAGVSDGLLYRYFDNKRALLDAVLKEFYEGLLARLEDQVLRHDSFEGQFRRLVELHLTTFIEDPGLCRLFISEVRVASNYRGSETQVLNRRYTKVLLRVMERAEKERRIRPGIDLTLFRDLVFGGIEHLAWRHVNGGRRLKVAEDAAVISTILLDGVKP